MSRLTAHRRLLVFAQASSGIHSDATRLEVPHNTRHRPVFGQLHDRRQRYALSAGFSHEA